MAKGLLAELVEALRVLPGVGPKGAQRMAFHLLERNREGGRHLAQLLDAAMQRIRRCSRCRDFTEDDLCRVCSDPRRDAGLLCVVESPADVAALEAAGAYRGRYFVLHGHLSPIDGIGPEDLGLDTLEALLGSDAVKEVILATNATVEGEATAHYIAEQVSAAAVPVSRIAHGVPLGGELEYIDGSTLAHALAGRRHLGGQRMTTPVLVTDLADADAVLARCRLAGFLAMDTEFMRTDTFYAIPALYQVNDGQQTALLDPVALDGVHGLADLMDDPELPVIMHGCSEDVDLVSNQMGARLTRLFDTQLAVAFCGGAYSQSYRGLVQDEFGVEVDKEATRSDWLRRPLSDQQLHYAAQDVAWLPELYQRLRQRLGDKAAWHAEECSHLVADVLDGPGPADWYRNVKGAWRLDSRQLAALQRLTELREQAARERDRPRNRIMRDEEVLAVVVQDPPNLDGLRALLHPGQVRRDGEHILDLLEDVRRLPRDELPERLPQPLGRRSGELLKSLRKTARAIAAELDVAEELVARRRLLEDLLRVVADHGGVDTADDEDLLMALPARFLGWRLEPVTRPLLQRVAQSGFATEWAA